ncbi:hypothetical protein P3X46_003369 [Hevea brasiliensis]|uniref:Uncharacterized protein n=1 Tax=Hevea brasiliensis TaxID=3981 RepID=A0ABQ9N8F3_HEVBR|nr:hypothetical protein P3X46_003369 [Hevea brasiliensis]
MMIFSRQDDKKPTVSIKLAQLVIDELEGGRGEGINLLEEHIKTETTTFDCTTPTAKEHKIPDVMTCPPAPRKSKLSLAVKGNGPNKIRTVKEFFASPELEAMLGINRVSSKISWSNRIKCSGKLSRGSSSKNHIF